MNRLALFFLLSTLVSCSTLYKWGARPPEKDREFFQVRWAKNLDTLYVTGNMPMTVGGVSSAQDILFVGSLDGTFRAVDVENGRDLWLQKESMPIAAPALIDQDQVFYGTQGGRLIVRHMLTGELKYAIDLGAPIESAPVLYQGRVVLYLRGHQVVCLDAITGKIIWNYRRAVPVTVTLQRTTRPLFIGDKVIVGFADGFAGALSLQEGTLLWEQKLVDTQKFVDVDLNPVLVDGLIVTGSPSGELKALDPGDGSIRRNFPISALSHPLLRSGNLIFGTADGELVFMDLTGAVLKRAKVSKRAINQVLWWKDCVVAITFAGELLALDPLTFNKVGRFALGNSQSAIFGDVALSEQGLGVLTTRNRLFFFE